MAGESEAFRIAPGRKRFRWFCGIVALATGVLALVIGIFNPASFFHAYLFAALACLNPALGCLLLAFIHRMTGGTWGQVIAPALGAGQQMVPWTLLFFLPLFCGLAHLFPWAAPGTLSDQGRVFLAKHPAYFSEPAFIVRAIFYAVIFFVLLGMARRGIAAAWTGPVGMILYVIAVYLLSVDWVLSLEPGWSSTGFPVVYMASQALSAMALCIAVTIMAEPKGGTGIEKPQVWKDLGNLLLGLLMFWAYVAYAQFLVVWSGNFPKEAVWYLHRNAGNWHYILIALGVFQLLIPLILLLSSRVKRRTPSFAALAGGILLFQILYIYWLILPSFRPTRIDFHLLDLLLPLGLGALWLFRFLGIAPVLIQEKAHV
jgi:hypothetical protein